MVKIFWNLKEDRSRVDIWESESKSLTCLGRRRKGKVGLSDISSLWEWGRLISPTRGTVHRSDRPSISSQYQGSVFLPTSCKSSESGVGWRETRQQLQSLCSTAVVAQYKSSKYRGQYHCNIFYMWSTNSSGISLEWNQSMIIPPAQIMSCGKNTWWALRVEEALWSLTLLICEIYHTIDLPLLLYFLTIKLSWAPAFPRGQIVQMARIETPPPVEAIATILVFGQLLQLAQIGKAQLLQHGFLSDRQNMGMWVRWMNIEIWH